ncbi:nucleotide-binding protein [Pseudomonas sp. AOB-7]|uniref:TIR domain-containing protein n=1 Tax=Pseudomonas sp. AOB-7 TaxID=2482750 RepID=UPI000EFA5660|nr:nucleotide-binding protein [Pseudomonas sp. AOB-7]RMH86400.1 nucleotide-binding protein [Pseudomonas sp. AOB-7]
MARQKNPATPVNPKLVLTPTAIQKGIIRLDERIAELESFNYNTLVHGRSSELTALIAAIKDTLDRCFGEDTSAYNRLKDAFRLEHVEYFLMSGMPSPDYKRITRENVERAVALLKEGQRMLREDLIDCEEQGHSSEKSSSTAAALSKKVFIVHGREEGPREAVARFLQTIGLEPIILHEQASKGRTVIEKVEAQGDVSFAVVLLTPDDTGSLKGGAPEPRARQNVLLELGYFIGRLGRPNVCALMRGNVEIPSDFAGSVWVEMDESGGWKSKLSLELQEAGHVIDWNLVMGRK